MKTIIKTIDNIDNIENQYIKFFNILVRDALYKPKNEIIRFIVYDYTFKIDDNGLSVILSHFTRLNYILENNSLQYVEDYLAKYLYLNDLKSLEEKSQYRLEKYLTSHFYNN